MINLEHISEIDLSILICPICKSKLEVKKDKLFCLKCNKNYSIFENYIDFLVDDKSYWGEISQVRMHQLLNDIKELGFDKAVYKFVLENPNYNFNLLSHSRLDWIFHKIDYNHNGRYLDVGSGLGTLPFLASKIFKEVYSVENIYERVQFQTELIKHRGIKNIFIFRSTAMQLPFKSNFFDFICVNGVLEWIGLSNVKKNPKRIQIQFLNELKRILKPNGTLYIGIENRLAPKFFSGAIDHSGFPYTSLMPRVLANLFVKIKDKPAQHFTTEEEKKAKLKKYSTYTYTYQGYKKLLKRAGFTNIDIFYVTADYNEPDLSYNLNMAPLFINYRRNRATDFKRKLLFNLLSYVPKSFVKTLFGYRAPCYLIYANKRKPNQENFECSLLRKTGCTNFIRLSGRENLRGKIIYFLGKNNSFQKVAKFSRFDEGNLPLQNSINCLKKFNNYRIIELNIQDKNVYIEPYINGRILTFKKLGPQIKMIDWLIDFQEKTQNSNFSNTFFKEEKSKLIEYLIFLLEMKVIDTDTHRKVRDGLLKFYQIIEDINLPTCSEHGDFFVDNILFYNDKYYHLDFEYFQEIGNPIFDFCFYIFLYISKYLSEDTKKHDNSFRIVRELINRFVKVKNIPVELIFYGFPYTNLRVLYLADPIMNSFHRNYERFLPILKLWKKFNLNEFIEKFKLDLH